MVLGEEMDLRGQGGTVRKLGVSSRRSYWVKSTDSSVF